MRKVGRNFEKNLDCGVEQVTLSWLETVLTGEKRTEIVKRRKELRDLTEKLKREYMSTMFLLSDCARFNSVLLRSIFNIGNNGMVTYGSNGSKKHHAGRKLVNLQF